MRVRVAYPSARRGKLHRWNKALGVDPLASSTASRPQTLRKLDNIMNGLEGDMALDCGAAAAGGDCGCNGKNQTRTVECTAYLRYLGTVP